MPRKENAEARESIQRAAFAAFRERGYTATSYTEIAARCGMNRALVQYYFKKKETLALALFTRLLEQTVELLGYTEPEGPEENRFAELYRIGQVHFAFLCKSDGYLRFLQDVLGSRELTEDVLAFNGSWAFAYLGRDEHALDAETMDSVIMGMGGFYELLYHCLREERRMDIAAGLHRVMATFMEPFGYTPERAAELLASGKIGPAELEAACARLVPTMYF